MFSSISFQNLSIVVHIIDGYKKLLKAYGLKTFLVSIRKDFLPQGFENKNTQQRILK